MLNRYWPKGVGPRLRRSKPRSQRPFVEMLDERVVPALITVNSAADPGSFMDTVLTLREGIELVNGDVTLGDLSAAEQAQVNLTEPLGTNDTIQFDGSISLITLSNVLLIKEDLLINGPGAGDLTIDANNGSRIFSDGSGGSMIVSISGLTLTGGADTNGGAIRIVNDDWTIADSVITGNSASGDGGAIYTSGTVTIQNSTLSSNTADSNGGGIRNQAGGTVTITQSSILTGNSANYGGAIFNENSGTVTIQNSSLDDNTANFEGGGIFNEDTGSTVTLTNSALSANSAGLGGGGIFNDAGTVMLQNSNLSANSASSGGGIFNSGLGTVSLTNSSLSGNLASSGGGIYNSGSTVTLQNSTLSGNSATSGGGVYNRDDGSTVTLQNSTLSGNSAAIRGGGIYNVNFATVTIQNSTLSGNSAGLEGGGIHNQSGPLTLQNSLIAGNTAGEISNNATFGTVNANANNLFGHEGLTNAQAISGFTPGASDITATSDGTDPTALNAILGPLQDNGGPTLTHALVTASPAVNAGNNTFAAGLTTDQRGAGFPRIIDGTVDIGAFEFLILPPLQTALDNNQDFTIIGATGSPTSILSVKIFDGSGNLASTVQPFNNLTSLRVAAGDFDGDGVVDEFAVLGRRTNSDLRAEIVTYDIAADGSATETARFFAFDAGILGNGFIAAGDFDGDGDDDLAVAQIGGGRVVATLQVHLSNGDGTFSAGGSTTIDFGVVSAPRVAAGDTDGDGMAEIVVGARTPAGARILIFDGDTGTPVQQGAGFTWTFGIDGYSRGAFVAVGEFDPNFTGAEIVLGSNVGGGGRVDIVSYDGTDTATLVENGRLTPFGDTYNAAVRVAVGQLNDRNVIVVGQDRFQDGQYSIMARQVNTGQTNPPFEQIPAITALTTDDGLAPPTSPDGNRTLGPFVSFANLTNVVGLLAPTTPEDFLDGDPDDLDLILATFDERAQIELEG